MYHETRSRSNECHEPKWKITRIPSPCWGSELISQWKLEHGKNEGARAQAFIVNFARSLSIWKLGPRSLCIASTFGITPNHLNFAIGSDNQTACLGEWARTIAEVDDWMGWDGKWLFSFIGYGSDGATKDNLCWQRFWQKSESLRKRQHDFLKTGCPSEPTRGIAKQMGILWAKWTWTNLFKGIRRRGGVSSFHHVLLIRFIHFWAIQKFTRW